MGEGEEYTIVVRWPAVADFLHELGIRGKYYPLAKKEWIQGRTVIGIMPVYLAAMTKMLIVPVLASDPDFDGVHLTLDDVRRRFRGFQAYTVNYAPIPEDLLERIK